MLMISFYFFSSHFYCYERQNNTNRIDSFNKVYDKSKIPQRINFAYFLFFVLFNCIGTTSFVL